MNGDSNQSGYRSIVDDLGELYAELNGRGMELRLWAVSECGLHHFSEQSTFPRLGSGAVETSAELDGLPTFDVVTFVHDWDDPYQRRLAALLVRAGTILPNRIRKTLLSSNCTTASSWFLTAVWTHSAVHPHPEWRRQIPPNPDYADGRPAIEFVGWCWKDPIAACLSAIESMGLLAPSMENATQLDGEWSVPMSKTEFARRILEKPDARARDVFPIWEQFEKTRHGANIWTFRLDTLPAATRKKLEGGKP